jgi:hypothetical protein
MEKKPRPTLTLKKKPAAGSAAGDKPQARPAFSERPKKKPAKAAKPAKQRKPRAPLPPHRRPSEARARALVESLQRDYPALFPADGSPITHPWAVGIHGHIMHRYRESKRTVRKALEHWSKRRGPEYARCIAQGGPRFGLDGTGGTS